MTSPREYRVQTPVAEPQPRDRGFEDAHNRVASQEAHPIPAEEAAEMIHDVRNTRVAVSMLSELMATDVPPESPVQEIARDVRLACQHALTLCARFVPESDDSCGGSTGTDLSKLVTCMTPLVTTWMSPGAALRFDLAPGLPLLDVAPDAVGRIVMNLVKNAAEALSGRPGVVIIGTGWIELTTADVSNGNGCGTLRPGRHVCLTVADTGCGIDRAAQLRLRQESFTTKANGHGLGLASVRRIVADHHAGMQLESQVGAGTTVRVVFTEAPPIDDNLRHSTLDHTNERDFR